MQCLETTLRTALALHAPYPYRIGETLQMMAAKVDAVEQATHQPASTCCDQHRIGFGECLKAGCEVGCLSDDRLLLSCSLADEVADHHPAGGDDNADLQRSLARPVQCAHCLSDGETGPHGALCIVFAGSR